MQQIQTTRFGVVEVTPEQLLTFPLGLIGFSLSVIFRIVEHYSLAWYRGLRQAERGS